MLLHELQLDQAGHYICAIEDNMRVGHAEMRCVETLE